jgi:VIT1/CCC1 family predicted Fe2+/Mn2+ transporter
VLGANDGIVSTSGLIVVSPQRLRRETMITGVAGLVAASMSMAAGEYSQSDTEQARETQGVELQRRVRARGTCGDFKPTADPFLD